MSRGRLAMRRSRVASAFLLPNLRRCLSNQGNGTNPPFVRTVSQQCWQFCVAFLTYAIVSLQLFYADLRSAPHIRNDTLGKPRLSACLRSFFRGIRKSGCKNARKPAADCGLRRCVGSYPLRGQCEATQSRTIGLRASNCPRGPTSPARAAKGRQDLRSRRPTRSTQANTAPPLTPPLRPDPRPTHAPPHARLPLSVEARLARPGPCNGQAVGEPVGLHPLPRVLGRRLLRHPGRPGHAGSTD